MQERRNSGKGGNLREGKHFVVKMGLESPSGNSSNDDRRKVKMWQLSKLREKMCVSSNLSAFNERQDNLNALFSLMIYSPPSP